MARPGIRFGIALALLLLGAVALGEALEWPFLRAPLQDALTKTLQLDAPFGVRFIGALRLRSA